MLQRATTKDGRRQQRRDFSDNNQPSTSTLFVHKIPTKVRKFVHAVLQEKEAGDATFAFGWNSLELFNIGRIIHNHGHNQECGPKYLFPTTCRMSNHPRKGSWKTCELQLQS